MMEMNEEVMIMEEDARELNETETYEYDRKAHRQGPRSLSEIYLARRI